jgi:hypothetical protein
MLGLASVSKLFANVIADVPSHHRTLNAVPLCVFVGSILVLNENAGTTGSDPASHGFPRDHRSWYDSRFGSG